MKVAILAVHAATALRNGVLIGTVPVIHVGQRAGGVFSLRRSVYGEAPESVSIPIRLCTVLPACRNVCFTLAP